ncbi:cysteine desulfurase [Microbacteriaceae bacterium SG_E_30_P1]|uniref:Cysteine desulfurase n=1 Tax=Antiquaquibacter oligotrophicus TaxID=2880260 RepID=A0ABT6KM91_9MICO|nr:cysteine desulfurase family protein [Antiquaquibacter oligotrophicus]MDH6181125.1 cysteine desulfurase [Antiquaquibacter oligotrophicus]UDF13178.1 cysteine desulfurase [Antiquaquibacter oligotrophicus]
MIYLDQAATTAVRREVLEAMWPYLTAEFGNPSSHHEVGEAAERGLTDARARVAAALGVRASEVVFTSGGTEAANLAIKGIVLASTRGRHIVTSAIEHPAVLESCDYLERFHGAEVTVLPVDADGLVDPVAFTAALRDDTALATIMYANNEIGTVQPIAELAALAHARGVPFHTDAVQAAGWLPIDLHTLGADALSLSGHKLGAPKGIGALAVRARIPLEPVIHGGGQERGRRSGTENVAGAVALATALDLVPSSVARAGEVAALRDRFIDRVLSTVPDARLTGSRMHRLPGHASFCFPGTSGESVLLGLEARGIVCSSGSACAAGSDEPSDVLLAIGLTPEIAQTAVRFTFGSEITEAELDEVARELVDSVAAVRSLG